MRGAPDFDEVRRRVHEIAIATLGPEGEIPHDRALIEDLGFDSLDMIELSFALEEFFEFEFSSRNALEELDARIGPGRLLEDGVITNAGRQEILERMPELAAIDLPEVLTVATLTSFFSLDTFVRLIHDVYEGTAAVEPATGEERIVVDFKILTASGQSVTAATGDQLLDHWLEQRVAVLSKSAAP